MEQHVASHMLGRNRELALLQDQLTQVITTRSSAVVLVRGEAGIGKSALLKAFIESSAAASSGRPLLVGYGQAMTHSLGSDAFQALRECLRSLAANAERSVSKDALIRVAHALRVHAPDWLESVPLVGSLLAAGVRTGMTMTESTGPAVQLSSHLDQLTALVADLFESGPVVMVLDDLHWADTATLDVIMALALKVEGPLLLVLAYRPDDLRPGAGGEPHPLTRALFRLRRYRPACLEIDLRRLSEHDTASLILSVPAVRPMTAQEVRHLVAQSAGIPLYAESLALIHGHGSAVAGAGAPPREITAVIEERLSFVPPDDQRLLEIAVIVGFAFEVKLVAELAKADLDDVYDRLDRLLREHHLIVEADAVGDLDRYALYHPMLAEILRQKASTNAARWRRYHVRLVDLLLMTEHVTDEIAVRAASAAMTANDRRAPALALDAARRQYRAGAVSKAREIAEAAWRTTSGAQSFDLAELLARSLSAEASHRSAAAVCAAALTGADPGAVSETRLWNLRLLHIRSLRMINDWTAVQERLCQCPSSAAQFSEFACTRSLRQRIAIRCERQSHG